jgi:hypothetical protein
MARTVCRHRLGVRVVHAMDCVPAPYISHALSPCAPDAAAALHHLLACIAPPALAASTGRRRLDGMEFRRRKPPPSRASQGRAAHRELLPFAGHQLERHCPSCPSPPAGIRLLPSVSHAGEHIIAIPLISSLRFASHPSL